MITDKHKQALAALAAGAVAGRLAIVETTDKQGEPAFVVALFQMDAGGMQMMPIARLFNKEPFDEVNPPEGARGAGVGTIDLSDPLEA